MSTRVRLRHARRLFLFIIVPAVSALAPLAVIPAVTSTHGAAGWASCAVALSLGGAGAVLAELGWGVVGPQAVARAPRAALDTYRAALASKTVATLVVMPIAAASAALIASSSPLAAALVAAGVVTSALSPSWFFTGLGQPLEILLCETLPRVVTALMAAAALHLGAPLEVYGIALLLSTALTLVLSAMRAKTRVLPTRSDLRSAPSAIQGQGTIVVARAISTAYTTLPASVLGVMNPSAVAVFAASDRQMKLGLSVLSAIPRWLQRWLGHGDPAETQRRSRIALVVNGVLGLAAGATFSLFAPLASRILFTGVATVGADLAIVGGLLVAVICFSRGQGLVLVSQGRAHDITRAVIAAAIVGVVGLLLGSWLWGATGAAVGMLAAELTGAGVQARSVMRAWSAA